MRDEQDAGRIPSLFFSESREECLAKARWPKPPAQHHNPSPGSRAGLPAPRPEPRGGVGAVSGASIPVRRWPWAGVQMRPCLVSVDPGGRQLCDLGPGEQRLEGLAGGQKRGRIDRIDMTQVPFDAVCQRRPGQVRRPDDQRPAVARKCEHPGLGVKRDLCGLEHMQPARALKVGNQPQRRRFRHAQIVAGQEPQLAATVQQIAQMRQDQPHAGGHQEGYRQIDGARPVDQGAQMGVQRIFTARDQRAIMGHARQGTGCRQWRIKAQVDMAASLDQRHQRVRPLGLEEGLRGSDPSGKGRLLSGGKLPPAGHMTAGRESKACAVADQDNMGVTFYDGAGGGIAYRAGRVA